MTVTRKIDKLGRIVIPVELRRQYGIHTDDTLLFITESDVLIGITKTVPTCVFCKSDTNLSEFCGKCICEKCRNSLN